MISNAAKDGAPGVARDVYNVTVERDGRWWVFTIAEIGAVGQASKLSEVEHEARGIIEAWDDVPVPYDTITLDVSVQLPTEIAAEWNGAVVAEEEARAQMESAAAVRGYLVRLLRGQGWTAPEIAAAVGLSKQRVYQLENARIAANWFVMHGPAGWETTRADGAVAPAYFFSTQAEAVDAARALVKDQSRSEPARLQRTDSSAVTRS